MATTHGYIALNTMLNLPGGEYLPLGEAMGEEGVKTVGSNLFPTNVLSIVPQGIQLTTRMKTEMGAGIQATADHKVIKGVKVDEGYQLHMTSLVNLNLGDLILVNPRREGDQLLFELSPVEELDPFMIEEVYEVTVDAPDGSFLANGIINQGAMSS